MSWLDRLPPKIRDLGGWFKRKDPRSGQDVIKDPKNGMLVHVSAMEKSCWVNPATGYHFRVGARKRLDMTFDKGVWEEVPVPEAKDPLKLRERERYSARLKKVQKKTDLRQAILVGFGAVEGIQIVIAAHDFDFIGGSVGIAEGEAVIIAFQTAIERRVPLVIFTASGGARLQEGIFAVMQLARTTIARVDMRDAGLPYVVVLTNPTMGGVTASYGMLGDVTLAEPEATVGFAGKRVIIDTLQLPKNYKFPDDFQTAEAVRKQGFVDMIVDRRKMRVTLARICREFGGAQTTITHLDT